MFGLLVLSDFVLIVEILFCCVQGPAGPPGIKGDIGNTGEQVRS